MRLKSCLLSTSLLFGLFTGPVVVKAADMLAPRVDVSVKGGSERSTLTTEFWAPLAQKNDRVIYADVRLMGDNDENREGNLGIGYRQLYKPTSSVIGIHGWIDRRRTEHNSTFHQATLGVESLGDKLDLRANGYVPLNGSRSVTLPNIGSTTPYLAGNGLFYDTNGFVNETSQYGMDAEVGYRLPVLQTKIDALRVFGGGYHFFRSGTENVTGFRIRTEAQINRLVSVGARFQHDGPRGSQGFLEATLRFPFSAKKLYQTDKLRSRLDESPERDIDIVTASKVDNGLRKEITNTATGQAQRILYVDNSNTNGGDGTKENPYNNLKAAEAALQANDILYVFHGNGTTNNMDQGITINKDNIQMIGSGSALTYGGFTLLGAGAAPVITNTITPVDINDVYVGHGIMVLSDNAYISGITIDGANFNGIRGYADGKTINSLTIDNVTTINNKSTGIALQAQNMGRYENATVTNTTSNNNLNFLSSSSNGIATNISSSGGSFGMITMQNNTVNGNGGNGFGISATNGNIDHIIIDSNTSINNGRYGAAISVSTAASIADITLSNFNGSNNGESGVYILGAQGSIQKLVMTDITTNNNAQHGIYLTTTTSTGSINNVTMSNVIANSNASRGVAIFVSSGAMNDLTLTDITANSNATHGILVHANNGSINNVNITRAKANNNTQNGIHFYAQATTSIITGASVSYSDAIGNGGSGLYVRKGSVSSTLTSDFGGGSFASVGQNRIFGNTGVDLYIDRAAVIAGSNWWNNGGAAPSRVTLINTGASASYGTPLAADPRP